MDHLQVEYLQMTPLTRGVGAAGRVLDLHNVESALVRSYARAERGPRGVVAHARGQAALAAMERAVLGTFDTVVVVSERERARLPGGARRGARVSQRP